MNRREFIAGAGTLAAMAVKAENVAVAEIPLGANIREGWFKLYMSDVGLLAALYGTEAKGLLYSGKLVGNAKGGIGSRC